MTSAAAHLAGATMASAVRSCPQCASEAATQLPQYSTDEWRVVACVRCGFVYLSNPPPSDSLMDDFAWEKTYARESLRRRRARPRIFGLDQATRLRLHLFRKPWSELYRRLFKPGRVLDVGCGDGTAIPPPFVPFGIEISRALYDEAVAAMAVRGGRAVRGPASQVIGSFPDGYFTGVMLSSVVEHETEPKRLLAGVARVLTAGGAAYIRVPNFGSFNRLVNGGNWCGFRHPDHVNYFTVASLRRMVRDCGLKLRLLNPIRLLLDDNINAVLTKA
jgi:SAM-dependent methyltransferase/Zn ribbon nucleic-acid-binding protein